MGRHEGQAYLFYVESSDDGNTFSRDGLLGTSTNGLAICLCCPRDMLARSVTPKNATRCQPRISEVCQKLMPDCACDHFTLLQRLVTTVI